MSDQPKWHRRKEDRPDELVEAAFAEFERVGYASARLSDIAKRAGVSKGTIYRYFDSKQSLFEAVVLSRIQPVLGEVEGKLEGWQGSAAELLAIVITTAHDRLVGGDLPALMRIIVGEGQRFPLLLKFYHEASIKRAEAMMSRILKLGVQRGEFVPSAATETGIVVMAPAIVAMLWQFTFQPLQPISTTRFLEAHLDLILRGILVDPVRE